MGVISRGIKNVFRNNIRTISIVLILSVSIAMSLIMFMSLQTVQGKIESVKSSIGNYIIISPAGIRGFEGGGELLTEEDVLTVSSVKNVEKVVEIVSDRLTPNTDTNLQSAIEPGSFGNRQQSRQSIRDSSNNPPQNFSMPIMITGTSDLSVISNLNLSKLDILSGEKFEANTNENLALIGTDLANKNNLTVGSIFQIHSKDAKVVGVYDGGTTFGNAGIIMPIKNLQILTDQADQISSITAEAVSIDAVVDVENDIKTKLGSKVDITSQQDSSQEAIKPLENIKTISLYSLIGSLAAGAIIIFLTMVMIVRERRREIGVLKAIGASNLGIVAQFSIESLVLALTSSVFGVVLGLALSNPILRVLVNNSESVNNVANPEQGPGQVMKRFGASVIPGAQNVLNDLQNVIGWEIILYGLLAAALIAFIGSALPAFIISKIRPAEILRSE